MKKILVPTDFSDTSMDALRSALGIAKASGSTVILLHAIYPNQGLENNVYEIFWDNYSKERKEALDAIVYSFQDHPEFSHVSIVTATEVGFPAETIRSYVAKEAVDLIVMGTTGSSDLEAAVFGTNTISVALNCEVPLLTVPRHSRIKPHTNFAFATDLEIALNDSSRAALKAILVAHHNPLKVVHIVTDPEDEFDTSKESIVHKSLNEFEHDVHYLYDASVPDAVSNFVEAIDATGLIVVSHQHSFWHKLFFHSGTKALMQKINLPVLVLHG
jgi:nucleotide-binding universal stress UspA family protein